ncbi:hypothetical protein As57867_012756, partial [Aphanomyces stellatus]
FTHIPLFRPAHSDCGPRRTKSPITPGDGVSYQNVVSEELSTLILDAVTPLHVFSGDDHTPCTYHHAAFNTTEDSLATFSWLQGERHPEVTLLSLGGNPALSSDQADADPSIMRMQTCTLPDQMGIYIGYGLLGGLSLVYLGFGTLPSLLLRVKPRPVAYAVVVGPIVTWYLLMLLLSTI